MKIGIWAKKPFWDVPNLHALCLWVPCAWKLNLRVLIDYCNQRSTSVVSLVIDHCTTVSFFHEIDCPHIGNIFSSPEEPGRPELTSFQTQYESEDSPTGSVSAVCMCVSQSSGSQSATAYKERRATGQPGTALSHFSTSMVSSSRMEQSPPP